MQQIKISELKPHPRNTEFFDDMTGEKWQEFLESIKTSGVIEPIVITQDKTIVSGHQRVRACKEIGITDILADVRVYDSDDKIIKDLLETNIRQRGTIDGSSIKQSRRISELERIYGIKNGRPSKTSTNGGSFTQDDLLKQLGLNKETYRRVKSLATLPQEIQDLVESGDISASTASRLISKLSPSEQEELISSLDTTKRITQKQVQQYIDEIKKKDANTETDKQRIKELETKLKNQKPIIQTVDNTDYRRIAELEDKVALLETQKRQLEAKAKIKEEDAAKYNKLKSEIAFLTQQKEDLRRQFDSTAELSKLTVRLQNVLEQELAPIKFKRCMEQLNISNVARENIEEIIDSVERWVFEMKAAVNEKVNNGSANFVECEVINRKDD